MKINHSMCIHCVYVLDMYTGISCNFGQKIISGYGTLENGNGQCRVETFS